MAEKKVTPKATVNIQLPPGIYSDDTDYGAEGRWVDSDKVRFINAKAENIGGWEKAITDQITGRASDIIVWRANDGQRNIAIGTHTKLYVIQGGTLYDITPLRDSTSAPFSSTALNAPFSTTSGSPTVTVAHTSHGLAVGDTVVFSNASTVGGLDVNAEWVVASVTSADEYTFTHTSNASSTASGGGGAAVDYDYEITIGQADATFEFGYGTGDYGEEEYGDQRSTSTVKLEPRIWSFDTWGENLIATYNGGKIFEWVYADGTGTRAVRLSNAPSTNHNLVVSNPDRHLVAFGAHDGTDDDALNIRWSDQENNNTWTPSTSNSAGSQRVASLSGIMAALRTHAEILIWTENDLFAMQFQPNDYVFGFQQIGARCGAVSAHAAVEQDGVVYWMGYNNLYVYDGRVQILPCPMRNTVFGDINTVQLAKVYCSTNSHFNEIMWFYPSADSTNNDRYICYNTQEKVFYGGTLDRSTWFDDHEAGNPVATGEDFYIYTHETGVNADGSAMTAYLESSDFDISDGHQLMFLDKLIPDFTISGGDIKLSVKTRRYPSDTQTEKGPYTVLSSTKKVDVRARGRTAAIRIESNISESDWRMGTIRLRLRPDGRQ